MNRHKRPTYDEDEEVESALVQEQRATEAEPADVFHHNPHLSLSIQQQRSRLPIAKCKNQLLYLIECYRATIICGETGCGKSTQLVQVSLILTRIKTKIKPFRVFSVLSGSRMVGQRLANCNYTAKTRSCDECKRKKIPAEC